MKRRCIQFLKLVSAGLRCVALWMLVALGILCRGLVTAWCALAVHFSNLPWPWARAILATGFVVFAVWALWLDRGKKALWGFVTICLAIVGWWSIILPSHDRPWKPEVSVMPRAIIDGNHVRITGFRNFSYRSNDEFDIRHEEREFDLSKVTSVDFFISYWQPGPVGHTFVSFNFEDADPLCISIEVRPEVGEGFAPVGSLFKQFELIYVAGDERDIVGVRAGHRGEEVYLYRTRTSRANARNLLDHYLERMNELADKPEFYHLLSNSCTVNTARHAWASAGLERRFDIRYLLNGLIDQFLYSEGLVDNSLPFAELRKRSRIDDRAAAAGESPDFSQLIRSGIEPRHPRAAADPGRHPE